MTTEERFQRIEAHFEKNNAQIERQNAGIKDLVSVSRAVLDSIVTHRAETAAIMDEQRRRDAEAREEAREERAHLDGKINALIDTIDRMIREPGERGQQ